MARGRTLNIADGAYVEVEHAVERFEARVVADGLRPATLRAYKDYIRKFVDWLEVPLSFVSEETIDDYVVDRRGKVRDTTIQTEVRHIKRFLYFCMEKGWVPKFKIKLPKADEPYKEPYTDEEVKELLRVPKSANFVEWRTWLLVSFLLATGARISTALEVRIEDVKFEEGLIYYRHTKNRRNAFVPLSAELNKRIKMWIKYADLQSTDFLFPNYYGEGGCEKSTIQQEIRKYNRNRGISKTSAHLFRHTFAKNYILNGGNPAQLQRILGHANLSTTQKYVLLYGTDLKNGFSNLSSLDNFT